MRAERDLGRFVEVELSYKADRIQNPGSSTLSLHQMSHPAYRQASGNVSNVWMLPEVLASADCKRVCTLECIESGKQQPGNPWNEASEARALSASRTFHSPFAISSDKPTIYLQYQNNWSIWTQNSGPVPAHGARLEAIRDLYCALSSPKASTLSSRY